MKAAIIGAGRQGNRLAKAIKDSNDDVAAVVDIDESKAAELAKAYGSAIYSDWRTVVRDSDIDAIVVCTPNDTHAEISIEALKAGKHVLCEKPIARNVDEATRILEASRKSMAKIKCGFNHRYHPAIMRPRG